MQKFSLNGGF